MLQFKILSMKAETATKTQLAKQYKVNYNTFIKWLKMIPELGLTPNQRVLTPKQVQAIYNHLGEP
jgi:predicted transcriptional regulator